MSRFRRHCVLALTLVMCPAVLAEPVEGGGPGAAEPVTVMTRNLYVGADIFRVVEADPTLILATIIEVYNTVVQTNFAERAEALADEVLEYQPHLIGLQEVSLIRRQSPGDVFDGNPIPATDANGNIIFQTDVNGNPLLDANGNPIPELVPVEVTVRAPGPWMSANGAASSSFFAVFDPGGTHAGDLSPAELRLLAEWLDIGAQYFNNPFDAPAD